MSELNYFGKNKPQPQEGQTAIILAGGLGTRLREALPELPKCLAPVAGWPFLYYVINQLRMQGIQKFIFSLGYRHEAILEFLEKEFQSLDYSYVIESEPLGTGGAISFALQKTQAKQVFVVNGDTLFRFSAHALLNTHQFSGAECTLALKPMKDFDRYGVVEMNENGRITSFKEKQPYKQGLINAGVYLIHRNEFLKNRFPQKFSFEKDYLERFVAEKRLAGLAQDVYFIDIGIPEDFARAQTELQIPPFSLSKIDKSWTLFLDRDGVINHDKPTSYVFKADEFEFMEGAPHLFKKLADRFGRIVVVTNQRAVGKGMMTLADLEGIHKKMMEAVLAAGGRIDGIYFSTGLTDKDFLRKPNPGMALAAQQDFPEISFEKSIMIGNNITDMQFARNAGIRAVYLPTTKSIELPNPYIDLVFDNLDAFARAI